MMAKYEFTEAGKGLSQYFTPPSLAKRIVDWAELPRGHRVLEPSAGDGGLVRFFPRNVRVTAFEMDPQMVERLRLINHPTIEIHQANFLQVKAKRDAFDVAIMNPPYEDQADGKHIAHALRFAERVIALVRANFEFGVDRYNSLFRWAAITRRVVLTRRPPFYGPGDQGHGARHEYEVLELVRRETDRREDPTPDQVETEFWTEAWPI
ncbi:COG2263 Predicted RNA methylase [uncultured Caudovirales phage]|uniref:COG2263 Predicted RNA methylase n=1 Tax=uncultured Caudovirales phage TaxID=2100421 RepID=A0A6J5NC39_9CAUD|nr:COG2263 Predicted RNA methylase [uncultured Caudovirales phage]